MTEPNTTTKAKKQRRGKIVSVPKMTRLALHACLALAEQERDQARAEAEALLAIAKAMRKSIRHAHNCKAPQAYPCTCDAEQLWKDSGAVLDRCTNPV